MSTPTRGDATADDLAQQAPGEARAHTPAPTARGAATRRTAAGRLIAAAVDGGDTTVRALAACLGVSDAALAACRAGETPLPLEEQLRLAAAVLTLAPRHARQAHRLYAQAQAAMRAEVNAQLHLTYPKEFYR